MLFYIIFKNVDSDPLNWFHNPLIGYDLQFEKYWLGLSDKEDDYDNYENEGFEQLFKDDEFEAELEDE